MYSPTRRFACARSEPRPGSVRPCVVFSTRRQILAGVGVGIARDLLGRSCGHNLAARRAAFRAQIDDPIRGFDHVEIVLDDHHRSAAIEELAEGSEQLLDVVEVQTCGGLVKNVEHAGILRVRQVSGELEALGLAAGKRRGGLAEAQITQADFLQDF